MGISAKRGVSVRHQDLRRKQLNRVIDLRDGVVALKAESALADQSGSILHLAVDIDRTMR